MPPEVPYSWRRRRLQLGQLRLDLLLLRRQVRVLRGQLGDQGVDRRLLRVVLRLHRGDALDLALLVQRELVQERQLLGERPWRATGQDGVERVGLAAPVDLGGDDADPQPSQVDLPLAAARSSSASSACFALFFLYCSWTPLYSSMRGSACSQILLDLSLDLGHRRFGPRLGAGHHDDHQGRQR